MRSDAFRRAVEALDLEATMMATFSSSLVMHSPVRDEPLQGKDRIGSSVCHPAPGVRGPSVRRFLQLGR